jgi:predicted nuclease with TOPRIM domain
MSDDATTALLKTIAAGMEDLRKRVGRVESMLAANGDEVNKLRAQTSSVAHEVSQIKGDIEKIEIRVDEWIVKTEPVTKAYSDVPKIMRGVVATISVVAVVLTAWWSGGISTVMRFLTQPPVQP